VPKEAWIKSFPAIEDYLRRVPETGRSDLFETITLHRWSEGRVAIVGDAAHGMVPGLGQGCGTAITNAFSLAVYLEEVSDISTAVDLWERRERPLTEHTQFWSWTTWPLTRVPSDIARTVFNFPGFKEWLAAQRSRTSLYIPYGTEKDSRWKPQKGPMEPASQSFYQSLA